MTGKFAGKLGLSLVGAAGATVCLTLLSLSMRSVLDLGGFCASGGPYDIAVQCPQSVDWLLPVSIIGGLIFVALFIGLKPFDVGGLPLLAWSALFLALGWNFLDYGIAWHGHDWQAGFLVPGILFVLMGGVPLPFSLAQIGKAIINGPEPPTPALPVVPNPFAMGLGSSLGVMPQMPQMPMFPTAAPPRDMTTELERLATLHQSGDLSDSEYQSAKDKLIGGQS